MTQGFGAPTEFDSAREAVQGTDSGLTWPWGSSPSFSAHRLCGLSRVLSLPLFLRLYSGEHDITGLEALLWGLSEVMHRTAQGLV